ncbi:MAG: DUF2497 domain-containing protein [Hyphomonadaceae bacterium]
MAEQATKEPTMEEILASIRRIISEDGSPVGEASGADISADTDEDDFFAMNDDLVDASVGEAGETAGHLLSVDELLESEAGFDEIDALSNLEDLDAAPAADNDPLEEVFASDELDTTVAEIESDVFGEPEADTVADAGEGLNSAAEDEIDALLNSTEEITMTEPAPAPTPVTPTAPAAAPAAPAAAALGLAGGGATIEGLVSELMRPIIKEWIDANLSGIVERKVEAEIQQVANKVVAALREA